MLRRLARSCLQGLQLGGGATSTSAPAASRSALLELAEGAASTSGSGSSGWWNEAHSLLFSRSKYTYRFKQAKDVPGLIYWKPNTPGQRHKISINFDALGVYTGPPVPALSMQVGRTGGRDHLGRLTVRGRGGGEAKVLRNVDYDRKDLEGVQGVVLRIEHDPNRSAFLALTRYDREGRLPEFRYHVAPMGVQPGSKIMSGDGAPVHPGCVLRLREIPLGTPIHNLELQPGKGGKLVRSAHTSAVISVKQEHNAIVKLPSGELRLFALDCRATVGVVSNPLQKMTNLGKAGENRKRGRRPKVRGIAMNPVDHPHGGRTNGGRPSCTPWGVYTKGKRTRRRNSPTNKMILVRKGGQPISKFVNAKKTKVREAAFGKSGSASGRRAAAAAGSA